MAGAQAEPDRRFGHSAHGTAFDAGLRSRPWVIEGVGECHFEVTTTNPEVQMWFDQGLALLHSFWYEEAERSFRWCAALDPDCAMAYWGMAAAGLNTDTGRLGDDDRFVTYLRLAVERKGSATPRERALIEAWEAAFLGDGGGRNERMLNALRAAAEQYPKEVEFRVWSAAFSYNSAPLAQTEALIQGILKDAPNHPGAHHYRIHAWDGENEPRALSSCEAYGGMVTGIGHAQHMPGHIYSTIGMWKEAARSMESATRIELQYMKEHLKLPYETWNYAHNRNYLCYIQENLGMAQAAIEGARGLLLAPLDPEWNSGGLGPHSQGRSALVRALVSYERWDELSAYAKTMGDSERSQMNAAWYELVAACGKGDREAAPELFADYERLHTEVYGSREDRSTNFAIAQAMYAELRGDFAGAETHWRAAEATDSNSRRRGRYYDDPPSDTFPVAIFLAENLLAQGKNGEALKYAEAALDMQPCSGFSYSLLAQAHFALGDVERAREYAGRLLYVWSEADNGLRWMEAVELLGLDAEPIANTPKPERDYDSDELTHLGPLVYEPFHAPALTALDIDGRQVTLEDYRGKNVLLVFYLSDECVHCVEQLMAIAARASEFEALNTELVAISSATPEANRESLKLGGTPFELLSDSPDHANARRFDSYDDFEKMELHSTFLINAEGEVVWKRTGGDPFTNIEFLLEELGRMQ